MGQVVSGNARLERFVAFLAPIGACLGAKPAGGVTPVEFSVGKAPFSRARMATRIALIAGAILASASAAHASRPVPRTIVGCVVDGTFTSDDGYVIQAKNGFEDYDLSPFEGRCISVKGMLSPGDRFQVERRPRDLGPCRGAR